MLLSSVKSFEAPQILAMIMISVTVGLLTASGFFSSSRVTVSGRVGTGLLLTYAVFLLIAFAIGLGAKSTITAGE